LTISQDVADGRLVVGSYLSPGRCHSGRGFVWMRMTRVADDEKRLGTEADPVLISEAMRDRLLITAGFGFLQREDVVDGAFGGLESDAIDEDVGGRRGGFDEESLVEADDRCCSNRRLFHVLLAAAAAVVVDAI